ncbi:hypothetical protein ACQ859_01170 [Roseateles chitinivorans]|uniref:hypothetical protein n=1 Tax=Roseateles chitinivorans TaxID=2917965 RepID=UPI003D66EFE7
MSGRRYRRRRRDDLSSAVDGVARIAAKLGPVGALWTGVIGFAFFYAVLPACVLTWCEGRKAALNGPAAAIFAHAIDQIVWQRVITPSQWAGIATLLVCGAIAIWKLFDQADLEDGDVTLLSAASRFISRLVGH